MSTHIMSAQCRRGGNVRTAICAQCGAGGRGGVQCSAAVTHSSMRRVQGDPLKLDTSAVQPA